MAIISRNQWKLHPKIIEFWEIKRDKSLECYGQYWEHNGLPCGAATYFYRLEIPQIGISTGDDNVIARHDYALVPQILYMLDGKRYIEEEFLKIIKLSAFT